MRIQLPQARSPGSCSFGLKELQAAMSEASLIIHSPPDFPKDAEVVGICTLAEDLKSPNQYGWMVADFLRFKSAFYRVGHRDHQSWLSSIDVAAFIHENAQGEIEDDSPIRTHILGRDNSHISRLPDASADVEQELLSHISLRAQAANTRRSTLVLMFFSPITADQDIVLDFHQEKICLTTTKLCEAIREAVGHSHLPVVYMTPSPLTAGWMCRPALMGLPSCTFGHALETVAKSCGAVFADSFMRHLVEKETPLLSDFERRNARYDMLQPVSPSAQQTELFQKFQEYIYRTLKQRLCPLPSEHASNFETLDSWAEYAPRVGRPLSYWADRFNPLGGPGLTDRFDFLGDAFGGTKASQLFHLQYLTMLELATCPGDWGNNSTGETLNLFQSAWQVSNPSEKYVSRLFNALEFRASSIALSQCIAKALDLPLPGNFKCRYWHDVRPGASQPYYEKFQAAFGEMRNLFGSIAVNPREERHDFKVVRFWRPSRWLSAAIALKFEDNNDKELVKQYVLHEVAPRIRAIADAQLRLLLDYDAVHNIGRSWLSSIGLCNDPVVVAKKEEPTDVNGNADMGSLPKVLQSLSVLNPDAPEYKATVSEPKLNVQKPLRDDQSSDRTPRLPIMDMSDTKAKEIERVNESAPNVTTTPLISQTDLPASEALENIKPLEFTKAGEQAKDAETNTTVESIIPTQPGSPVDPVESTRTVLCIDPAGPDNPPTTSSAEAAAQVVRSLMNGDMPSSVLAELLMKAAELVSQRDANTIVSSAAVRETQGVSAQLDGSSNFPAEQNIYSLLTGKSAPAMASGPVSTAEGSCSIPWEITASCPTIRKDNATLHGSPPRKDVAHGQCQADDANDSTNVSGAQKAERTTNSANVASSGGIYEGEDFWTMAQHFVRRW